MRKRTVLGLGSLVLGSVVLMGADCPFIPSVEEKLIELAVGSSTTIPFEARGEINVYMETECFDFGEELDLEELLDDAGIDVTDVKDIKLAGVSYRITRGQAGRSIEDGTVSIWLGGCTPSMGEDPPEGEDVVPLVTEFSQDASAVTDFITADLDPAGVAKINEALADVLDDLQGDVPSGPLTGGANISGFSVPSEVETDFDWEIKLDITILGEIEIDTVDF